MDQIVLERDPKNLDAWSWNLSFGISSSTSVQLRQYLLKKDPLSAFKESATMMLWNNYCITYTHATKVVRIDTEVHGSKNTIKSRKQSMAWKTSLNIRKISVTITSGPMFIIFILNCNLLAIAVNLFLVCLLVQIYHGFRTELKAISFY